MPMSAEKNIIVRYHAEATKAIADIKRMNNAMNDNVRSTKRADAAMKEMNREAVRTSRMTGSMSGAIRNASFQIADFAIMATSGQGAMKAFAVQGGQLLGAFGTWGAILGGVVTVVGLFAGELDIVSNLLTTTTNNIKQFGADLLWAAEQTGTLNLALGVTAGILAVQLIPLIGTLTKALLVFTASHPIIAFAGLLAAGALAVVANWDKVKAFFTLALPAAIEQATASWYGMQRVALEVVRNIIDALADLVNTGINKVGEALTAVWNILPGEDAVWKPFDVAGAAVTALDEKIKRLQETERQYIEAANKGFIAYDEALKRINAERKKAIELATKEDEKTKKATKSTRELAKAKKSAAKQAETLQQALEKSMNQRFVGAIDQLADGIVKAELNFKEFARSFLQDIAKMILRTMMLSTLQSALGGGQQTGFNFVGAIAKAFGGGTATGAPLNLLALANAQGNAFDRGNVVPFASGGIVNNPTLFPMARGKTGLMGEAGPEAVVPLKRDSKGNLGVSGSPVHIHNYTGHDARVEERNGERHIIIGEAVKQATSAIKSDFARSMTSGQGDFARALEAGYGARRKAV